MQYKTIIMELLENQPIQEKLRQERKLLTMIERLAIELRTNHLATKAALEATGVNSQSASSRAMESAVAELAASLSASPEATASSGD